MNSKQVYRHHQFDFVIDHSMPNDPNKNMSIDKVRLIQQFGKPTAEFDCPDNYHLYAYRNHRLEKIFQSNR